jgi:TonB family protein
MTVTRTSFTLAIVLTVLLAASAAVRLHASEALDRAKELYHAAAYDEALTVLDGLSRATSPDIIQVHEYRVFCLVALDRKDDAQKAMAALVAADPFYAMSEEVASPRVRSMFAEVRRSLLPGIVQRAYTDARAAYERKDPQALDRFERVLSLLKDPDLAGSTALTDLATVAAGFRDLSRAFVTPIVPAAAAETALAPRPAAPPPTVLIPPVAVSQAMPVPQLREERQWDGEVEVTIDDRGRVTSARMTKPIHPMYDQQLLRAASSWTYKPALRNGVPAPFVKQISIHLDTRPVCTSRVRDACRPAESER